MPEQTVHDAFMAEAIAEACKAAEAGEAPVGAVAVSGGVIVARAGNRVIADNDPTAHAEMLLVRALAGLQGNYRLQDTTIYVTLEPCPMCIAAAAHARIEAVYYGASCDKWGYMSRFLMDTSRFNHQPAIFGGYRADEAAALLKKFFASRR